MELVADCVGDCVPELVDTEVDTLEISVPSGGGYPVPLP